VSPFALLSFATEFGHLCALLSGNEVKEREREDDGEILFQVEPVVHLFGL
jgi:hypothetical protein